MVAIQKQNEFYIQNEVINMKGLKTNSVRDSKAQRTQFVFISSTFIL